MKQRLFVILSVAFLASPLAAQDVSSQIADQLRQQGYENVEVTKTWLGRLRFQASSNNQTREIIVNPRTGEILRDFQTSKDDTQKRNVKILGSGPIN